MSDIAIDLSVIFITFGLTLVLAAIGLRVGAVRPILSVLRKRCGIDIEVETDMHDVRETVLWIASRRGDIRNVRETAPTLCTDVPCGTKT